MYGGPWTAPFHGPSRAHDREHESRWGQVGTEIFLNMRRIANLLLPVVSPIHLSPPSIKSSFSPYLSLSSLLSLAFYLLARALEEKRGRRVQKSNMSSRRSRITEDEINELISKLQSLLPEARRRSAGRVNPPNSSLTFDLRQASAAKLLKETCNYIKSLHREVDDLSDRLSGLMATMDTNSAEAEIVRSLLQS
ncbi:hypothetical protein KFK09_024804 [Dendrobium nobile]|uniref:BHLH domain-containing protein n=1 Tax=Dendrobium nobile TaxID=94219 RepID=A0A8T3AFW5_DENNO|nr:hypothetical protein KFK09_024804 [Dendrobium nobile]